MINVIIQILFLTFICPNRSRDFVDVVDMAHVNKLKSSIFRLAAAVTSVRTQSCVGYECFGG